MKIVINTLRLKRYIWRQLLINVDTLADIDEDNEMTTEKERNIATIESRSLNTIVAGIL